MSTVRESLDDLKLTPERREALAALGENDAAIDYSDIPATEPEFWQEAELKPLEPKKRNYYKAHR